jgi:hypothetical protein
MSKNAIVIVFEEENATKTMMQLDFVKMTFDKEQNVKIYLTQKEAAESIISTLEGNSNEEDSNGDRPRSGGVPDS